MAACNSNTTDEKEDPAANTADSKTYIIYSDNSFAPFEYLDVATGTYVGLDMDILAAIAEDQGFQYEVKNEGFDPAMAAVQSGQADAMIAGMTITEERTETYDFSEGYFEDGQIMIVAAGSEVKSLDDLSGKVVATKASTQGFEYADSIKDEYGFTLQVYEDSPTMYAAVMQGVNVACFEDRTVGEWAIKSQELKMETVGDVINPKQYGFAVKKGENAELIKMFNDGLKNLKDSGKYDEILAKYGF
jgi:polar amino acid transport system substrate-binding protein